MVFGTILGWFSSAKKDAEQATQSAVPRSAKSTHDPQPELPKAETSPTDNQRKQYAAVTKMIARFGADNVATANFRQMLALKSGTDDERILRLLRHPDLALVKERIKAAADEAMAEMDRRSERFQQITRGFADYGPLLECLQICSPL